MRLGLIGELQSLVEVEGLGYVANIMQPNGAVVTIRGIPKTWVREIGKQNTPREVILELRGR